MTAELIKSVSKTLLRGVLVFVASGLCALAPLSRAVEISADAVKATFLYRFAAYVDWPTASSGPFTIGIVDHESIAQELERLAPTITVKGRKLQVRRLRAGDSIDDVQILFVGPSNSIPARLMREAVEGKPVLMVTDAPRGLQRGAVINFVSSASTVRFEISLSNASRAGLRIDSRLLSVAARVEGNAQSSYRCPQSGGAATDRSCLP